VHHGKPDREKEFTFGRMEVGECLAWLFCQIQSDPIFGSLMKMEQSKVMNLCDSMDYM